MTRGKLCPIQLGGDNTGLNPAVYPGVELNLSARVEYANGIAVDDTAHAGILGTDFENIALLEFLDGWQIGKSGVQEVVGLAGEQFQRVSFRSFAMS